MNLFITFEGPEGSGKTTQAELLSDHLVSRDYSVNLTREPGGTSIGETIREILLDPDHHEMDARTELLLYLAARAQHVSQRIRPALNQGEIVICDRFTDATLVYQGMARNLGVETVTRFNQFATDGLTPDLTFILDVPLETGLKEARSRSKTRWNTDTGDRIEQEDDQFHLRVREGYRQLAEQNPRRYCLLNRDRSIEEIQAVVQQRVEDWLKQHENQSAVR